MRDIRYYISMIISLFKNETLLYIIYIALFLLNVIAV